VPSAAERAARARGMKGNAELAEQFGINEGDYVRELVRVDELPTPPSTESEQIVDAARSRKTAPQTVNLDEFLMSVFKEEAEEIRLRLERVKIPFSPAMEQGLIDYLFTVIALNQQGQMVGGGAIARR
jgi:hypothetical protein